ncbi:hypothetical protein AQ490_13805 [Wenjunlia vitaminophila]|uniref:Uncharacterized protein n=1 Tax=Wenjunlia vitaminophila TaxID=76728 RepID=A0A0T6LVW6_WENVI|nr:hypothetical protein [Wenjunlia vitaminophila]KRV50196.1 hypothetical protein AQ490_13805 [Wenjunlia vitaminophila]
MGVWDRLRRRRAGAGRPAGQDTLSPAGDATGDASAVRDGAEVGGAREPAGARDPDGRGHPPWDGGWRAVPSPVATVLRSAVGVSDGLRFRSRLAAWQNPSLGRGLGHAVLPSAPVGVVHGVTRPSTHTTWADGAPLLLRAARPGADTGQEQDGAEHGPAPERPERAGRPPPRRAHRPRAGGAAGPGRPRTVATGPPRPTPRVRPHPGPR